jgi:penicillin V acylase-like amidase (Ntn superfamily)
VCTRVLWNTNDLAVLVGRSMDWPESTEPLVIAFPRGRDRDGGRLDDVVVVAENPLRWTSRYGSVVASIYGVGTIDGINEKGLAAHGLYLESTDLGSRDVTKPGLQNALWAQYLLDQAATVDEALALMDDIQLILAHARGFDATIHLALEDASGDSAIIEFAEGRPVVHHGREYTIMTNDPTYDEQLELLAQQDYSKPSSEMPLPGNINAVDRFQRASYYAGMLPAPKNEREAVAGVLAIMRNVSVPFGAPDADFGVYNTEYRTVADTTNRRYFFELSTSANLIWVDLDGLNLDAGAPVLALDPYDYSLIGDVTDRLAPRDIVF